MKKIIGILILTASLPAFANGFYLGGLFGITSFDVRSSSGEPAINSTDSDVTYGAFAGYQFDFPQLFLALEGDFFLGDTESSRQVGGSRLAVNRKHISGLSGLLGLNINDYIAVYGRLGWGRTKFDFTENGSTYKNWENASVYGAGMRYEMLDWLSLRFDYRYVKYHSFEYPELSRKFDVNDQMITVGLQYNF